MECFTIAANAMPNQHTSKNIGAYAFLQKQLKPTHADPKRFMQSTTTGCLCKIWFATNKYLLRR